MDINFHYFAIKALAVTAGFEETEAQTIAVYSQFVDDYNMFRWRILKNVPDYAKHLKIGPCFNPVTTGFRKLDYAWFAKDLYRRRILIPFHFIPKESLRRCNRHERVEKYATGNNDSKNDLLNKMLDNARSQYQEKQAMKNSSEHVDDYQMSLIRVGILLHILADTYAHQRFSGNYGWENDSLLTSVKDKNNDDRTSDYSPKKYYKLPSIGHATISTAPDESNVSFEIKQRSNSFQKTLNTVYKRDNIKEFLEASHIILSYLRSITNCGSDFEEIKKEMNNGFARDYNPKSGSEIKNNNEIQLFENLRSHWNSANVFPCILFSYDKDKVLGCEMPDVDISMNHGIDIMKPFIQSDHFYRYNTVAYEIRREVTGENRVRDMFSEEEEQLYIQLTGTTYKDE